VDMDTDLQDTPATLMMSMDTDDSGAEHSQGQKMTG